MRWLIAIILLVSGCMGTQDPVKIIGAAVGNSSIGMCDKIQDLRMRHNCSIEVAFASDNASMCDQMDGQEWADECYSTYGVRMNNITLCQMADGNRARGECIRRVSTGT
jgi:hypothetical protein